MVTRPLASFTSHVISNSCSSPLDLALDFLQTLPRENALTLWLTFGSTNTWHRNLNLTSYLPYLTLMPSFGARFRAPQTTATTPPCQIFYWRNDSISVIIKLTSCNTLVVTISGFRYHLPPNSLNVRPFPDLCKWTHTVYPSLSGLEPGLWYFFQVFSVTTK